MFKLFRRPKPESPFGEENVLSGYVPGLSFKLDMFALIVSLSQNQANLARNQQHLARMMFFLALLWMFTSLMLLAGVWL